MMLMNPSQAHTRHFFCSARHCVTGWGREGGVAVAGSQGIYVLDGGLKMFIAFQLHMNTSQIFPLN